MSSEQNTCQIIENINIFLPIITLVLGAIVGRILPSWGDKKTAKEKSFKQYEENKEKLILASSDYFCILSNICEKLQNNDKLSTLDYNDLINKGCQYLERSKIICVGIRQDIFNDEERRDLILQIKELPAEDNIKKFYTVSNVLRKKLGIKRVFQKEENYQLILDTVKHYSSLV
jgi:hypothetical protein